VRLGVISDTHGLLRPEAVARLAGAERIVHAGDIGGPEIVPRLGRIAPVDAIRGNVDTAGWAARYPEELSLEIEGQRILVLHDIGQLRFDPASRGYAVVICGHSHKPAVETDGRLTRLNPGSAGPRRFRLPVTLATVEVRRDGVAPPEIHDLLA
jgi:uncharacterized protein